MKTLVGGACMILFGAVASAQSSPTTTITCEQLAEISLPNSKITLAQRVTSGTLSLPAARTANSQPGGQPRDFTDLPAFCRVAATLTPTADSEIRIEVWLPLVEWNRKFMAAGNGGWSGSITYGPMSSILRRGYAVASTDTGHQSSVSDASWAQGHPEKQIDFGYRAVHEMTLRAKDIVNAFYGAMPRYSYWNGCSSGGKQGLKEAQQYPNDYDGIIAGAPANNWTHLMSQILRVAQAGRKDPGSAIRTSKYPFIHDAVLRQCDALDGVTDGLLQNPARCVFDPTALECKSTDASTCLTSVQVAALKQVYAPARNSKGVDIFPGLAIGGELGWGELPQPFRIAESHYKYIVFNDPNWDFQTFDLDRDLIKADRIDSANGQFNAIDTNLAAFKQRGGKLLQYHGWNDQQISPQSSIDYFESVVATDLPGQPSNSGGPSTDLRDSHRTLAGHRSLAEGRRFMVSCPLVVMATTVGARRRPGPARNSFFV